MYVSAKTLVSQAMHHLVAFACLMAHPVGLHIVMLQRQCAIWVGRLAIQ